MAIPDGEYLVTTVPDRGAALKHFRAAAGVTQTAAAEAMGAGLPVLAVKRYDRQDAPAGGIPIRV